MKSQTTSLPKNYTFSKDGITLTCPICERIATYQIGQLDREAWKRDEYTGSKWYCATCYPLRVKRLTTPPPLGVFPTLTPAKDDIDELLEML